MDSQASEMKLHRSHTLHITVTFAHGEILPTQHRLGMSTLAVPVGILCSLKTSASHCILTIPLRQSSSPLSLSQLGFASHPSLVQAQISIQPTNSREQGTTSALMCC